MTLPTDLTNLVEWTWGEAIWRVEGKTNVTRFLQGKGPRWNASGKTPGWVVVPRFKMAWYPGYKKWFFYDYTEVQGEWWRRAPVPRPIPFCWEEAC